MAREMKDSGIEWIGGIPEEWEVTRLGKYFIERSSKVSDYDYEPLSVTKQGIVKQLQSAAKTDAHDARKLVCKGDFVINSRSDRKQSCGLSHYDGSVSLINIVLINKFYSSNYISYLLKNYGFAEEFYRCGTGIVADLWSTNFTRMKKIMLPVPPISTQEPIADYLDEKCKEIDNIIENTKATIEEYKKYKQSVITEAVTKGLDPNIEMKDSGVEWIGEIPKHWEVSKLRFLGNLQNGISKSGDFFGTGYPFVTYSDVYKNMVLPKMASGLMESTKGDRNIYSVKNGDVFFTRTSETIEEIGLSSTCLFTIENTTFAGFLIRFRPETEYLLPDFSLYYFRSDIHRRFFIKEMNLVTRASLSQGLLKNLVVILPPISEQEQIANYLYKKCTEIDTLISKKQQIVTELQAYKKSLIYECVTGKVEV